MAYSYEILKKHDLFKYTSINKLTIHMLSLTLRTHILYMEGHIPFRGLTLSDAYLLWQ